MSHAAGRSNRPSYTFAKGRTNRKSRLKEKTFPAKRGNIYAKMSQKKRKRFASAVFAAIKVVGTMATSVILVIASEE